MEMEVVYQLLEKIYGPAYAELMNATWMVAFCGIGFYQLWMAVSYKKNQESDRNIRKRNAKIFSFSGHAIQTFVTCMVIHRDVHDMWVVIQSMMMIFAGSIPASLYLIKVFDSEKKKA